MIPKHLTYSDFQKATREIDKNEIPYHRASYRYFLIINGKEYPPKYVISIANKIKKGTEWHPSKFNAVEAKNYFINNGYTIRIAKSGKILSTISDEDEENNFSEGKEKFRLHRSYERNAKVSKLAKEKILNATGELRCEVCEFSFLESYGQLGSGYIEAHHKIPVSQLGNKGKTKVEDIALLCSNCHKIIHRSNPMISIEKLKIIINKKKVI